MKKTIFLILAAIMFFAFSSTVKAEDNIVMGSRTVYGQMGYPVELNEINSLGVNVFTYINNQNNFFLGNNRHLFQITNLDLYNNTMTINFSSEPLKVSLALREKKQIELDGVKMEVAFSGLQVNYAEITLRTLESLNLPPQPPEPTRDSDNLNFPPQPPEPTRDVSVYEFKRNLKIGDTGEDVRQLQIFLNTNGYTVAVSGPGSKGKETTKFGALTKKALIKFQENYTKEILTPNKLKKGTGFFYASSRAFVNSLPAE